MTRLPSPSLATLALLVVLTPRLATAERRSTTGHGYALTATTPAPAAPGRAIAITVAIGARDGYKVTEDYPIKLTIDAPPDVTVDRLRYERDDAVVSERQAAFQIRVAPRTAGISAITLRVAFGLCSSTACETRTAELRVPVEAR